jgi:hypothetical protein
LCANAMFLSYQMLTSLACRPIWAGILLVGVILPLQTGCVSRRMTIRSNPPGALVYVDDYPIGLTPVSTNFTYYGTRKIRLVKDGFETLTIMQPIPAPWYQYPPMDFIAENFVPGEIRDSKVLDYQMQPQMVIPTDQIIARAETLRGQNYAAPAGAVMSQPGGIGPYPQQGVMPQQGYAPQQNIVPSPGTYQQPGFYQPPNMTVPPGTLMQPNAAPPPNTLIPPGASMQPNTNQPPNLLTPPSLSSPQDVGGQPVYELPPR